MYSIMGDTPKAVREIRENPGLHGVCAPIQPQARRHIDELSRKYTGQDYAPPVGPHGRVILKVMPDKINTPRLLGR